MRALLLGLALVLSACASAPAAPVAITPIAGGATSMQMFDDLKSEDDAVVQRALATVEADPGAYLPVIFGGVAREMLERGRPDDAARWSRFGFLRMLEDIEYAGTISDRANHMALLLFNSYATDEGLALSSIMGAASVERRSATLGDALAMNAAHPRRYGETWVLHGRDPYEVNFVAAPAPWSAEAQAALAAQQAELVRQVREMDEAAAATLAQAVGR